MKIFNSKIFNGQSRTITSAALILALASMVSSFLGLFRDRLLAGRFGAGDTLDIYYAAFRVPDLIYNLLILGALSAGFIPVFVSYWRKNGSREEADNQAWLFVNNVLNLLVVCLVVLGSLFFLLAPLLVKLIASGFSPDKMAQTVVLTRIMFLSPLLLGISNIFGGVLQGLKRFVVFSLTPLFYNCGIIFGILFLAPRFGAAGLAWGVVIGAFLHMISQLPALFSVGFRYRFSFDFFSPGVRRLALFFIPRTLTLAISQLNFLAITVLASGMAAGSLAVFNFAYNIWSFPYGIFPAALAIAAFPSLADEAQAGRREGFVKTFSGAFRQILFLVIPSSVLFVVLRAQIVRVILGTGKFDWTDTILTIDTLQYLMLALFSEGLILLLIRGFFAYEDSHTPFWLGLAGSVFRVGAGWFFAGRMGVAGLALGWSLGSIVNVILLWIFLERKIGDFNSRSILASAGKMILSSLAAGGGAYFTLRLAAYVFDTTRTSGIFLQGLAGGIAGLGIYFLLGRLLKMPEIDSFWQVFKKRLPFKSVAPEDELIGH